MYTVRHSVQHNSVSTKVQQYKEGMPLTTSSCLLFLILKLKYILNIHLTILQFILEFACRLLKHNQFKYSGPLWNRGVNKI